MEIKVVSETITTHEYESKTLAKAFSEITGIKVKHDIIQEGDVVEKLQTQMQSGRIDLRRLDQRFRPDRHALPLRQDVPLTDYMAGEGKDVTNPEPRPEGLHRHQLHHRARTASSTSCPTSSSPTSTGSAHDWFSDART